MAPLQSPTSLSDSGRAGRVAADAGFEHDAVPVGFQVVARPERDRDAARGLQRRGEQRRAVVVGDRAGGVVGVGGQHRAVGARPARRRVLQLRDAPGDRAATVRGRDQLGVAAVAAVVGPGPDDGRARRPGRALDPVCLFDAVAGVDRADDVVVPGAGRQRVEVGEGGRADGGDQRLGRRREAGRRAAMDAVLQRAAAVGGTGRPVQRQGAGCAAGVAHAREAPEDRGLGAGAGGQRVVAVAVDRLAEPGLVEAGHGVGVGDLARDGLVDEAGAREPRGDPHEARGRAGAQRAVDREAGGPRAAVDPGERDPVVARRGCGQPAGRPRHLAGNRGGGDAVADRAPRAGAGRRALEVGLDPVVVRDAVDDAVVGEAGERRVDGRHAGEAGGAVGLVAQDLVARRVGHGVPAQHDLVVLAQRGQVPRPGQRQAGGGDLVLVLRVGGGAAGDVVTGQRGEDPGRVRRAVAHAVAVVVDRQEQVVERVAGAARRAGQRAGVHVVQRGVAGPVEPVHELPAGRHVQPALRVEVAVRLGRRARALDHLPQRLGRDPGLAVVLQAAGPEVAAARAAPEGPVVGGGPRRPVGVLPVVGVADSRAVEAGVAVAAAVAGGVVEAAPHARVVDQHRGGPVGAGLDRRAAAARLVVVVPAVAPLVDRDAGDLAQVPAAGGRLVEVERPAPRGRVAPRRLVDVDVHVVRVEPGIARVVGARLDVRGGQVVVLRARRHRVAEIAGVRAGDGAVGPDGIGISGVVGVAVAGRERGRAAGVVHPGVLSVAQADGRGVAREAPSGVGVVVRRRQVGLDEGEGPVDRAGVAVAGVDAAVHAAVAVGVDEAEDRAAVGVDQRLPGAGHAGPLEGDAPGQCVGDARARGAVEAVGMRAGRGDRDQPQRPRVEDPVLRVGEAAEVGGQPGRRRRRVEVRRGPDPHRGDPRGRHLQQVAAVDDEAQRGPLDRDAVHFLAPGREQHVLHGGNARGLDPELGGIDPDQRAMALEEAAGQRLDGRGRDARRVPARGAEVVPAQRVRTAGQQGDRAPREQREHVAPRVEPRTPERAVLGAEGEQALAARLPRTQVVELDGNLRRAQLGPDEDQRVQRVAWLLRGECAGGNREEKSEEQQTDQPQHPRAPHVRGLLDPRILAPVGGAPGPQFVSDPVRAGDGALLSAPVAPTGPR